MQSISVVYNLCCFIALTFYNSPGRYKSQVYSGSTRKKGGYGEEEKEKEEKKKDEEKKYFLLYFFLSAYRNYQTHTASSQ